MSAVTDFIKRGLLSARPAAGALTAGQLYQATDTGLVYRDNGSSWDNFVAAATPIFVQTNSVTVANTTTETTLLGTGSGSLTLPANFLTVGKVVRVFLSGYISNSLDTHTFNVRLKIGGTTIASTGTTGGIGGFTSNDYIEITALITCRTTGAPGTVFGGGRVSINSPVGAGASYNNILGGNLVATATTNATTTGTLAIDVTAQWGTALAANTVTIAQATVVGLN